LFKTGGVVSQHVLTNPDRPPPLGQHATAAWDGRVWAIRLTDEGKEWVADWVAAHPVQLPLFRLAHPGVFKAALASGMTEDDIERECQMAVVRAAQTFDSGKSKFVTYLCVVMHTIVSLELRKQTLRRGAGRGTAGDEDGDFTAGAVSDGRRPPGESPLVAATREETARRVRAALSQGGVSARDRRMIEVRYGLDGGGGRTLRETATALSVSTERVRQVEATVFRLLRTRLEQFL
jgi:RNA polymerase sigma factor (sigma-70 family)